MKKRFFFIFGFFLLMYLSFCLVFSGNKISAQTQEDATNYVFEQSKRPTDVPKNAVYEQLFRIINKFEQKAAEQENAGFSNRAAFLRKKFQEILNLDGENTEILKKLSNDFVYEIASRKDKRRETLSSKKSEAKKLTKIEKLEKEIKDLPLIYREKLQKLFGKTAFDKFESLVNERFVTKIKAYTTLENRLFLELSDIFYDQETDEVFGYAQTLGDGPDNCDQELLINRYCPWSEVYAVFVSDIHGQIEELYDFQCGNEAYVDFYLSGTDPNETFCIQSEHVYNPDDPDTCPPKPLLAPKLSNLTPKLSNFSKLFLRDNLSQEVCVTTPPPPNVMGVDFQTIAPNTPNTIPIGDNPGTDGTHTPEEGLRIFPDDDYPMENQNRQRIRVRASINEQQAGVTVYFRNFDLDDPSTDTTIDPNGTTENDNNGTVNGSSAGQLSAVSATTNAQGIATVDFTVTMQPGDNFAIAASTNQNQLNSVIVNGIDLRTGSGASIETTCDETDAVCRSEMLTVWRRLHIEVDSMGASNQNWIPGNFASGGKIRRLQQATLNVNTTNLLEVNRFQNGRVTFTGGALRIVNNTATSITVENTGFSTVSVTVSDIFLLYDDDDFNDNDGTNLDGDTGEDIPEPPTDLLQSNDTLCNSPTATGCNVFASSYTRPLYDITSDVRNNSIFQSNIEANYPDTSPVRAVFVDFDQRATQADPEFWTIYLYGTYQQNVWVDGDPVDEDGFPNPFNCPDASYGVADDFGPNGWGACVHMEVGRPTEYPPDYATRPVSRAWTAAHEIGHLFGGIHNDGGIMTPSCIRTADEYEFDPRTIRRLRVLITHP